MFTYHASHGGKINSIIPCFIVGDFAVLLRAGMTVKQAIIYNCVSSVLGFCGMLIGVLIGNFGSAPLWIFACIGGVFIYIAFVDMVRNYFISSNADASQTFEFQLFWKKENSLVPNFIELFCVYWKSFFLLFFKWEENWVTPLLNLQIYFILKHNLYKKNGNKSFQCLIWITGIKPILTLI